MLTSSGVLGGPLHPQHQMLAQQVVAPQNTTLQPGAQIPPNTMPMQSISYGSAAGTGGGYQAPTADLNQVHSNIWVGSRNALKSATLVPRGIKNVCNTARELHSPNPGTTSGVDWGDLERNGIQVKHVCLNDTPQERLFPFSPPAIEAIQFIDRSVKSGQPVLVNCMMGISRSASLAIAYLMLSEGQTFNTALNTVRQGRPGVSPNSGFLNQLGELERAIQSGQVSLNQLQTQPQPQPQNGLLPTVQPHQMGGTVPQQPNNNWQLVLHGQPGPQGGATVPQSAVADTLSNIPTSGQGIQPPPRPNGMGGHPQHHQQIQNGGITTAPSPIPPRYPGGELTQPHHVGLGQYEGRGRNLSTASPRRGAEPPLQGPEPPSNFPVPRARQAQQQQQGGQSYLQPQYQGIQKPQPRRPGSRAHQPFPQHRREGNPTSREGRLTGRAYAPEQPSGWGENPHSRPTTPAFGMAYEHQGLAPGRARRASVGYEQSLNESMGIGAGGVSPQQGLYGAPYGHQHQQHHHQQSQGGWGRQVEYAQTPRAQLSGRAATPHQLQGGRMRSLSTPRTGEPALGVYGSPVQQQQVGYSHGMGVGHHRGSYRQQGGRQMQGGW